MNYFIDLFCGAGGTTTGVELAENCKTIACVNHDPLAIASHKENHPDVVHFTEDVRDEKIMKVIAKLVDELREKEPDCKIFIWASLECTNFSKAKGGQPRDPDSRTLAECLYKYDDYIQPDGIWIENVEEFMAWGPLDENGKPVSRRSGSDYIKWVNKICSRGYQFDWKILNAADYGAYTSRKRYFAQFVRNGIPITWPKPSHAKEAREDMFSDLKKWKAVKEVLDFSDKGKSIFGRKKDLSENTLKRIYAGLVKYVAGGDDSFLKKYYSGRPMGKVISTDGPAGAITCIDGHAVVNVAFLSQSNGGIPSAKVKSVNSPSNTITTSDNKSLIQPAFIYKYHKTGKNLVDINGPASTITTKDRMAAVWIDKQYRGEANHQSVKQPAGAILSNDKHCLMHAYIMDTNFKNVGRSIEDPAPTILACRKHHYLVNPQFNSKGGSTDDPAFTLIARMDKRPPSVVQVEELKDWVILIYPEDSETMQKIKLFMASYGISDIFMRMLRVDELKKIQGFPDNYVLKGNQGDQKKFIGNSVVPEIAKALVENQAREIIKRSKVA